MPQVSLSFKYVNITDNKSGIEALLFAECTDGVLRKNFTCYVYSFLPHMNSRSKAETLI